MSQKERSIVAAFFQRNNRLSCDSLLSSASSSWLSFFFFAILEFDFPRLPLSIM